jgi:signal transduction histidine kinase
VQKLFTPECRAMIETIFDFSFKNPLGFLIAFIPGLINLGLVFYILSYLPKNRITNVFALLTLALSVWQLNDSISRICMTAEGADMWDCIFSAAWILVGPLCLHFCILYCNLNKQIYFRILVAFLYAPAVFFMGVYQAHIFPHVFRYSRFWGWVNYHEGHTIDQLMVYWISLLVVSATLLICYQTYKVRRNTLLKYQTLLIAIGMTVPAVTGIITQMVFPILLKIPSIPVTSTFLSFFSLITVIALRRYRLFSVSDLISSEALVESLPVMLFIVSEGRRVTFANRYGREAFRLLGEKPLPSFESLFVLPGDVSREEFNLVLDEGLRGYRVDHLETSLMTPRGTMDVTVSASPIINNKEVQGVIFALRDVTELNRSHSLVRHNKDLLKEAQTIANLGSWEWDIRSNTVTWSEELFRIFGFEPGEIKINYESYLTHLHPDDKEKVDAIIQKAFADHQPFEFYHRLIDHKTRIEKLIHSRGSISLDKDGPVRMNGTAQDVTEMKRNEKTLQKQNEELHKINLELDNFVYSVSHDLRSPLTSMLGLIGISELATDDEVLLEYFEMLKQSIRKMDKFILDILDYSKNSRTAIKREAIDFREILEEIIRDLRFMNGGKTNVRISTTVKNNRIFWSDKSRLSFIFSNLISNAIRYSKPDRADAYVAIVIEITDTHANIMVSDNGIGIRAELQEKVFEMFFRGSETSTGSGLGLYIVKETVQKMEGSITLESEAGKGTSFMIRIPSQPRDQQP